MAKPPSICQSAIYLRNDPLRIKTPQNSLLKIPCFVRKVHGKLRLRGRISLYVTSSWLSCQVALSFITVAVEIFNVTENSVEFVKTWSVKSVVSVNFSRNRVSTGSSSPRCCVGGWDGASQSEAPPSTAKVWPVMNLASSEAKNRTTSATSCDVPILPARPGKPFDACAPP